MIFVLIVPDGMLIEIIYIISRYSQNLRLHFNSLLNI